MATVTVLSASHPLPASMASKRVPLADNPNAANSPHRAPAVAGKRPRPLTQDHKDVDAAQSPPKKRQLLDANNTKSRRVHSVALDEKEGKVFGPRAENTPPTAFHKKLVAASRDTKHRDVKPSVDQKERDKPAQTDSETIKQWRRHYKKVFPSFVFYLESLQQDVCIRCSRQITTLGAREEKFFSKAVTHIVTTKPIPPPSADADSTTSARSSSSKHDESQAQSSNSHTINPSLLDKNADFQSKAVQQQKPRNGTDHTTQKRPQSAWPQNTSADVLVRAREMGIKIWPLEKFERMMRAIFDADHTDSEEYQAARKSHTAKGAGHEKDLSQLLKNEKNLPGERVPWTGITAFQGFYIYVHDIDEKTRPVMVRDYPKVETREEGEWPQFRCVPAPKCPFMNEEPIGRRDDRAKQQKQQKAEAAKAEQQPRTRAATAAIEATETTTANPDEGPVQQDAKPNVLRETDSNARSMPKPSAAAAPSATKASEPVQLKHTDSLPPQLTNRFQAPGVPRPGAGREPMASGLQRSNQTSAIRSQVISSTATNPTARAGVSKEMHQLQRRAVEHRHRATNSVTSVPSSYMNDVRAAINDDHVPTQARVSRRKPAQLLAKIQEDETQSDEEEQARPLAKAAKAPKKKAPVCRESKPGYCENCRDKYEDFEEHIVSKKHRKFALASDNWTELDTLLTQLIRK